MKVLLVNGSPHKDGTTARALKIVAEGLAAGGAESEITDIGDGPVRACNGCGICRKRDNGRCVFDDDAANRILEKMEDADGMIIGSPVHYAAACGSVTAVMGRVFYAGKGFDQKPGASVAVCRRAGGVAAFDQLNKYFTISRMPVVSSQYWNVGFGSNGDQLAEDEEGAETMKTLASNMVWMLKCIEAGRKAGVDWPDNGGKKRTNFVR
mgnify:CR=1 FL=1